MVLSQEGVAQDDSIPEFKKELTCLSCNPLYGPETNDADAYLLLSANKTGEPLFGQFQKITKTFAYERALTPQEIQKFVDESGYAYLRQSYDQSGCPKLDHLNYFLCQDGGKYYITAVSRDGSKVQKDLYETIPDVPSINLFLKKIPKKNT